MTTKVEKSIEVDVPLSAVYNQWTQFEEFPQFMGGVTEVRQLDDQRMHWVAEIAGVRREWDAKIVEQVPDQMVSWAATSGATNAGSVSFASLGPVRTRVMLSLEYEPEGLVEQVGDKLGVVERQATSDLERFKSFIEARGAETGGWRGSVEGTGTTPGIEDAAASRGDSGKAGITPKTVAAGIAAAAAAAGAAAALKARSGSEESGSEESQSAETVPVETVHTTSVTPVESVAVDSSFGAPDSTPSGMLPTERVAVDPLGAELDEVVDLNSRTETAESQQRRL